MPRININDRQVSRPVVLKNGSPLEPLIEELLRKRGISGAKEIKNFLEPQLKDLPDPSLMLDLDKAAVIIGDCVIRRGSILIWGDYDVDGTTATALLLRFFKELGCEAEYYIPNRLKEGYGLQKEILERVSVASTKRPDVLITVDNGISAHDAVDRALELGYTVIVTDHHTPPVKRVDAAAVLNPKQKNCRFPGGNLAGVGVAFYLAIGIRKYLQEKMFFKAGGQPPNLKQFLDLVAIGTVADMVELDHTNRILVRAGMETLSQMKNRGVTELCKCSGLDLEMLQSEDVSFQLAPKINAAGRLGCAEKAVSLLVSDSGAEARSLTAILSANNEERKVITIENFTKAKDEVSAREKPARYATIVAGGYHVGVAGIVASNLVEKYQRPAIVLCAQGDGFLKGSARSVEGVNLYDALDSCRDVLLGFGGHAMAAGMSLHDKDLYKFAELFEASVYSQNQGIFKEDEKTIEAEISVSHLFAAPILRQLPLLEPHGIGNPQPIFRDPSVELVEVTPIGGDKSHLRMSISHGTTVIKGIGFGLGKHAEKCRKSKTNTILYSPSINFFRGRRSWQVRVLHITANNN